MDIEFLLLFSIIVFFSSIVHGSIGFGFGMISTPLVALLTDIQSVIAYIVLPTMLVNIVSIVSEGKFFEALKKFWFIILLMIIGSSIGTLMLLYANSEYFKLLLAFIILVYLFQSLVKIEAAFIAKYPRSSTYGLGIFGGILSGVTNIVAPLMIIYTLELKYTKKDTIQLSNLCFLFTKIGQFVVLLYYGVYDSQTFGISFLGVFSVILGLYLGIKLKKIIDAKLYTKILKVLLFIIASILIVQTL